MKLKNLTLSVLLAVASSASMAGVMYHNQTIAVTQPNGEKLQLTVDGNTYYAEQRTQDGSLVVYDASRRGYCYASVQNDQLVSTGVLAGNRTSHPQRALSGSAASVQPGLSSEAKRRLAQATHDRLHAHQHEVVGGNGTLFKAAPLATNAVFGQLSGPVKGLTVMIQFPDQAGTITATQVSNFLNSTNYSEFGNAQSIRGYYQSATNNKVDYTNTVPRYYTAKKNKAYYTDPAVAEGIRAQELIAEALAWLQTSEKFDFSTLTTDANKKIRGLNFFYTGEPDTGWALGLWPHQGYLQKQFCANTVCASGYQISNMSTQLAIGTFAHESGHLLMNWPDLYDYDNSSEGSSGDFCLMASGSVGPQSKLRPVLPNAFFRVDAGWDTVTELNPALNAAAPKGNLSLTSNAHSVYRWTNPANTKEAFYLEAIQKAGQNMFAPDEGLAIWHIDPAGTNTDEWHPLVQLEQADGKRDMEYNRNRGDAGDLFDGVSTKTFSDTLPNALSSRGTNSKWWNTSASGLTVSNIGAPGASIAVTLGAGPQPDIYSGTLVAKGQAIHPANGFAYAGGTLTITLAGPTTSGVDFDLRLERLANTGVWTKVAESVGSTSQESIRYVAASGQYRVVVVSYAGAGAYKVTVAK
jgi:M6 family metalloprotease-like protein